MSSFAFATVNFYETPVWQESHTNYMSIEEGETATFVTGAMGTTGSNFDFNVKIIDRDSGSTIVNQDRVSAGSVQIMTYTTPDTLVEGYYYVSLTISDSNNHQTTVLYLNVTSDGSVDWTPIHIGPIDGIPIELDVPAFDRNIANQYVNEDTTPTFSLNFYNYIDWNNGLTFSITESNSALIDCRVVGSIFNCATPALNANGVNNIEVTARTSWGWEISQSFAVVVNPINDAPTFSMLNNVVIYEGETAIIYPSATDVDNVPSELEFTIDNANFESFSDHGFRWETQIGDEGVYSVTVTVSDPAGLSVSRAITVTVLHLYRELNVTSLNCVSPVIVEGHEQVCTAYVDSNLNANEGDVNVTFYYLGDNSEIGSCISDGISGGCNLIFPVGPIGDYTVYATASKPGYDFVNTTYPRDSFEVIAEEYFVNGLTIYSDSGFSVEEDTFYRGEDIFASFFVVDSDGFAVLDTAIIEEVHLVSAPGGMAEFTEFKPFDGKYYYNLTIPLTHDFKGNSETLVFVFDITYTVGGQTISSQLTILNNAPEILSGIVDEFKTSFDNHTTIDLESYAFDLEDSGSNLTWTIEDFDGSIINPSMSNHVLNLELVDNGVSNLTLRLYDLDSDYDEITIPIFVSNFNLTNSTNLAPVASLVVTPNSGVAPLVVVADACGSFDSDGSIDSMVFSYTGATALNVVQLSACSVQYTFDVVGAYTISVEVFDDETASSIASELVTVNPEIIIPIEYNSTMDWKSHQVLTPELYVSRIDLDAPAGFIQGAEVVFRVSVHNSFDHTLEGVKATFFVDGVDPVKTLRGDIKSGDTRTFTGVMYVPAYLADGYHDLKVTVGNDEITRIKFRDFIIN